MNQTLSWNSLGQLTRVITNADTVTYAYDGLGRRVRRQQGKVVTQSLYDGDDLRMELDGSGNPVREYMHFPGVDQPHSMRAGGQVYYYAMEQPGHVIGLFNSSNQVVSRYEYTDFGVTRA